MAVKPPQCKRTRVLDRWEHFWQVCATPLNRFVTSSEWSSPCYCWIWVCAHVRVFTDVSSSCEKQCSFDSDKTHLTSDGWTVFCSLLVFSVQGINQRAKPPMYSAYTYTMFHVSSAKRYKASQKFLNPSISSLKWIRKDAACSVLSGHDDCIPPSFISIYWLSFRTRNWVVYMTACSVFTPFILCTVNSESLYVHTAFITSVVSQVTEAVASRLSKGTSLWSFLTGLKSSSLPLVTLESSVGVVHDHTNVLVISPLGNLLAHALFLTSWFLFLCVFYSNRVQPLRCTVQWLQSWKAWVGCTSTTVSAVCRQVRPRTCRVPSACGSSARGWCRSDPAALRHCDAIIPSPSMAYLLNHHHNCLLHHHAWGLR